MRYFANPSTPAVREAMRAGLLSVITTPLQGNAHVEGAEWCADNGCFGSGYPGEGGWWRWLRGRVEGSVGPCAFAVAPDVVGDARATLARSLPWLHRIRSLSVPAAFVLQDGVWFVPWDDFDVLFIGGSTEFKLGPIAKDYAGEAVERGKRVHMGRVNSRKRLAYASSIGCSTSDGTFIAFGPDVNLPRVLRWLEEVNAPQD